MKKPLKAIIRSLLPSKARREIVALTRWPPVGGVRFGSFRRLKPVSSDWGFDRGTPVDRYYIEKFLAENSGDICGHVLEMSNNHYTMQFGSDRVTRSDVLDIDDSNSNATLVADLTHSDQLPSNTFDCFILTQTLQYVFDVSAAVRNVYRILKPGGLALVTLPGMSRVHYGTGVERHYWNFTMDSAQRMFGQSFPESGVKVEVYGNVLASMAFLYGLASEELRPEELTYRDPNYELLITVRALKNP